MFCSWVDYGTEEQCGERAELFANLPLCAEHADVHRSRSVSYSTISQCLNYYRLEDFPGLCYIVLLPDGSVKIGYSNTNELLDKRLKSLCLLVTRSRYASGIHPPCLDVTEGGEGPGWAGLLETGGHSV